MALPTRCLHLVKDKASEQFSLWLYIWHFSAQSPLTTFAVLVTLWACSLLKSQETLAFSTLRAVLKAQGLRQGSLAPCWTQLMQRGERRLEIMATALCHSDEGRGWTERSPGATKNDGWYLVWGLVELQGWFRPAPVYLLDWRSKLPSLPDLSS